MQRMLPAALLVTATFFLAPAPLAAAATPTVTVTGEGTVSEQPDLATLSVALITNDDDAQAATSKNNTTYAAIVGRLGSLGIAARMIRTSAFDITFVPKPDASAQYKPPRTGYIVTRRLAIDIGNLTLVGRALDAAVAAGATEVDGVSFGLRDARAAHAKALAAAMRDAARQAAAVAEAAHLKLGAVQWIAAGRTSVAPTPLLRAAAANVPTQIAPSTVEVRAAVDVKYALEP